MTTNPLGERKYAGRVTAEMLADLAERLNRSRFVLNSNHPYFVGTTEDGKACLDRKIGKARQPTGGA